MKNIASQGRKDFEQFWDNHRVPINPYTIFPRIEMNEFKSCRCLQFYMPNDWGRILRGKRIVFSNCVPSPLLRRSIWSLLHSYASLLRFEKNFECCTKFSILDEVAKCLMEKRQKTKMKNKKQKPQVKSFQSSEVLKSDLFFSD